MTKLTRHKTAAFLEAGDQYLILTHRKPDGDTLGSAACLCRGLRQQGKTAYVLTNPEVTPKYAPLLEGLTKDAPEEGDTLICVDVAAPSLLAKGQTALLDRIALRIDHHRDTVSFTPEELVDPDCASCGELIYDVLMELYADLDQPMSNALYTAVSTDTGCFRYANTTSHSFAVAAACAWNSPDIFQLNQTLFETVSLARLRLQGWLVENARFCREGKAVICALPGRLEQELGLTEDDMDGISGFPRTIEGVCLSALLRQEGDKVRLSVRAAPGVDGAALCARFGGGGHKGAAGAILDMSLEEAAAAVEAALPAEL